MWLACCQWSWNIQHTPTLNLGEINKVVNLHFHMIKLAQKPTSLLYGSTYWFSHILEFKKNCPMHRHSLQFWNFYNHSRRPFVWYKAEQNSILTNAGCSWVLYIFVRSWVCCSWLCLLFRILSGTLVHILPLFCTPAGKYTPSFHYFIWLNGTWKFKLLLYARTRLLFFQQTTFWINTVNNSIFSRKSYLNKAYARLFT